MFINILNKTWLHIYISMIYFIINITLYVKYKWHDSSLPHSEQSNKNADNVCPYSHIQ
jgi:hypothetical protein